ncbi:MAG: hypothetical protein H7Z13_15780 [Ferruginibacter sp.]|nr:hypothetical protein [Ferruginibacter sp.]
MKKFIYINRFFSLLAVVTILLLAQAGCKKQDIAPPPSISAIRNYMAAPGDSLINITGPGQWIVIIGNNLKGTIAIYFDGVSASFNEAIFSDTSAVVLLPSVIPFPSVSAANLNTIRYVTNHGETSFSFPIVPPAPSITSISNENANPGDTISIVGFNFFFIQSVSFAGTNITNYGGSNDGTAIILKLPAGITQSGPVIVTTKSGVATTLYNVNDVNTGVFCNFDNKNLYGWGSTSVNNNAIIFPGNRGNYARMSFASCNAFDWSWWNGGRGCQMNAGQWVPLANVNDPIAKWSLKFEVFVKNPWTDGCVFIHDGAWGRTCRFEPWKTAVGSKFQTTGWTTITIPMTEFRSKANGVDGTGTSATSISDLIGASGNKAMQFSFANPSAVVTNFDMAIDNIRIVQTK